MKKKIFSVSISK